MRNEKEKIIDRLLSLRAVELASKKTRFDGLLMLQKILFIAGWRYCNAQERVLGQSFYRWHFGPMSDEVYEDVTFMEDMALVEGPRDEEIRLTDDAKSVLQSSRDFFEENKEVLSILDDVSSRVEDLDSLLNQVYSMKVWVEELGRELLISDIPEGIHMLDPIWEKNASKKLVIDEGWLETIAILLDPVARKHLREAMEDARKGRFLPLEMDE